MRTLQGSLPLWLALFAGCQFQASCGGKDLRMDRAKELVASTLTKQVGEAPSQVTCPDQVRIEKGSTFACTAAFGPATAQLTLRQEDDEGYVEITSITGILISAKLEAVIAEGVGKAANAHFTVDCGPRVRPAKVGETFTCTATDAPGTQRLQVDVETKDVVGNVSWRVAGA